MKLRNKPAPCYARDVLAEYAHTVTSASRGAVTDDDLKLSGALKKGDPLWPIDQKKLKPTKVS